MGTKGIGVSSGGSMMFMEHLYAILLLITFISKPSLAYPNMPIRMILPLPSKMLLTGKLDLQ